MSALSPNVYRDILKVRAAHAFDVGGFLMRFYCYMTNIGVVTMITLSGYSFLLAGLLSSLIALTSFIVTPRISKLVDERGQSRVVPMASLVTLIGLAGMVACVMLHVPTPLLFACAFLMGCMPSPPALVRARWTYLVRTGRLGDRSPELRTVFSYEGIIDDVGFMVAPPLSITLAAAINPVAGMVFGGAAFAIGATVLTLARSSEPEPGWSGESPDARGFDAGQSRQGAARGSAFDERLHDTSKTVFRTSPVVRILFMMLFCVGGFYGLFDTAAVALAQELGNPNIASAVLALSCGVSVATGFLFGMLRLRMPQYAQLVLTGSLMGAAYCFTFLIDSIPTLFGIGIAAALFYAPLLITANATCERAVPGHRFTEAITWVNAGMTCGMAMGPTLAGFLIDVWGAPAAFDLGAVMALVLLLTSVLSRRTLERGVLDDVDFHL